MDSLNNLTNQLEECNVLINKINDIRDELTKALASLEVATNIGDYYSIDNVSADGGSIELQRKNISSIINNLGSAVSCVNDTISSLETQIDERKDESKQEESQKEDSDENESIVINPGVTIQPIYRSPESSIK